MIGNNAGPSINEDKEGNKDAPDGTETDGEDNKVMQILRLAATAALK
jgi:hypothetical protein